MIFIAVWVLIFRIPPHADWCLHQYHRLFCIGSLRNLFNTRKATMVMTLLGYYALIAVVILFVLKVTLPVEVFGVNANVRPHRCPGR